MQEHQLCIEQYELHANLADKLGSNIRKMLWNVVAGQIHENNYLYHTHIIQTPLFLHWNSGEALKNR